VNNVILSGITITFDNGSCNIFDAYLILIIMPLLTVLIVLIAAGVLLWLVNNFVPMDRKIKNILNVVVVIIVIGWLLKVFGVFSYLSNIHL
jgi:hypothetical protein